MFIRTQTNGDRTYLMLVENERVDGRLVQRVLHRFGRLDELQASGQIDGLLRSLGRFGDKLVVLDAHAKGESTPTHTTCVGPALIFERLWRECGIQEVLQRELAGRRFDFSVEHAIFLTVLHRLMAPGSDRAAERWQQEHTLSGTAPLKLQHLYRAMGWLGQALPAHDQAGATPFGPRTRKDRIEEALFARRRDLLNQTVALVFFDTTSISKARADRREGGAAIRRTIAPTSRRWWWGSSSTRTARPCAARCGPGIPRTSRPSSRSSIA